jgi:hypothetical protein
VITQETLSKILKGLFSAAIAFLGDLSVTLTGHQSFGDLTTQQWTLVAVFTLSAFGGTFGLAGWSGPRVNGAGKGGG